MLLATHHNSPCILVTSPSSVFCNKSKVTTGCLYMQGANCYNKGYYIRLYTKESRKLKPSNNGIYQTTGKSNRRKGEVELINLNAYSILYCMYICVHGLPLSVCQ